MWNKELSLYLNSNYDSNLYILQGSSGLLSPEHQEEKFCDLLFHICVSTALKWFLPFSYSFQTLLLDRNPYQLFKIVCKAITYLKLEVFFTQLKPFFLLSSVTPTLNGSNEAREIGQREGCLPCTQPALILSLVPHMFSWAHQQWSQSSKPGVSPEHSWMWSQINTFRKNGIKNWFSWKPSKYFYLSLLFIFLLVMTGIELSIHLAMFLVPI